MTLPPNFSFIWENLVAGCAHPGNGGALAGTLSSLREHGVTAILSLTEQPLDFALVREFEFDYLHLPIEDFTAPTAQQVDEAVEFLNRQVDQRSGVVVHCRAGMGRTGTILACFLVARGMQAAEAITYTRGKRPGSLEVYPQEFVVYQYAKRIHGDTPRAEEG